MKSISRVLVFGMARQRLGGIETFLLNMNKYMSKEVVFDYVVLDGPEKCIHTESIEQRNGKVLYVKSYTKNIIRYFLNLTKLICDERKTHEVAYINLFSMVHILPALICKFNGYKVVLHSHNSNMHSQNIIYRMLHSINRWLFGGNKKFIRLTCSQRAAEFMFGKGKKRNATMIHNAVVTDRFRFSEQYRNEIRQELSLDNEIKIIGFVGRLSYQKNPLFVVKIFSELCKLRNDCMLLMIGDGEYWEKVEEEISNEGIKDKVILLHSQTNIERYYSAMDVFILPSLFEGLPVVLVETQAEGLPSVVSAEAVTKEACVRCDFIIYTSVHEKPEMWAIIIKDELEKIHNRIEWNDVVSNSAFNILTESKRLQDILVGRNN